jgi:hypothetical protein
MIKTKNEFNQLFVVNAQLGVKKTKKLKRVEGYGMALRGLRTWYQ